MQITYKHILNASKGISELLKNSYSAKRTLDIVRLAKKIESYTEEFNAVKERLLIKFGTSKNGLDYEFDSIDKKSNYINELNILMETKIEIDFKKIEILNDDIISGESLMFLYDFVDVINE